MTSADWVAESTATLAINSDGTSLNVMVAAGSHDDGAHILFTNPINLQNATFTIVVRPNAAFVSDARNLQPYMQTQINNCSAADAGVNAANGCLYVSAAGGTQVGGNWIGQWPCWIDHGSLVADADNTIVCTGFPNADFNTTTPNGAGTIAVGIKQNGGGAAGGIFTIKSFIITHP